MQCVSGAISLTFQSRAGSQTTSALVPILLSRFLSTISSELCLERTRCEPKRVIPPSGSCTRLSTCNTTAESNNLFTSSLSSLPSLSSSSPQPPTSLLLSAPSLLPSSSSAPL